MPETDAPFDARISSSFDVDGRGRFVEIEILQGRVMTGDYVRVRLDDLKSRICKVAAVEFVDRMKHGAMTGRVALGLPELGERSVVVGSRARGVHPCPCCSLLTISDPGDFEICPVCFWQDDGQGGHDADVVRGGPNGSLSLSAARANFMQFGAVEQATRAHVRGPSDDENPR